MQSSPLCLQETEKLLREDLNEESLVEFEPSKSGGEASSSSSSESTSINCLFFRRLGNVLSLALGLNDKLGPGWGSVDWRTIFLVCLCIVSSCSQLVVNQHMSIGPVSGPATGCFASIVVPSVNVTQALCDDPSVWDGKASTVSIMQGFVAYAMVNDCMGPGGPGGRLIPGLCATNKEARLTILRDEIMFRVIPSTIAFYVLPLTALATAYLCLGEIVAARMFARLSARLMDILFTDDRVLYRLVLGAGGTPNYEALLTEDLRGTIDGAVGLFLGSVASLNLTPVLQQLFSVGYNIWYNTRDLDSSASLSTVIAGCCLCLCSVLLYIGPMNRVSSIVVQQQSEEGDLYKLHARCALHAESIAFFGGEKRELAEANRRFGRVYQCSRRYQKYQGWLLFVQFFITTSLVPLVSGYILLLITDKANVLQAQAQILPLLAAFVIIPLLYSQLGNVAGKTHRIGGFIERLLTAEKEEREAQRRAPIMGRCSSTAATQGSSKGGGQGGGASAHGAAPQGIELRGVTVAIPGAPDRILCRELSLAIPPGRSTVIMGPSGCGKTSLLRVIAGLWETAEGAVIHPLVGVEGRPSVFFVPQRTYLCQGSLRAQVIYPQEPVEPSAAAGTGETVQQGAEVSTEDAKILSILDDVGLGWLGSKHGLDAVEDWYTMLSGGEKQRLGFARCFYNHPVFAVMDEATSALDEAMQQRCLRGCLARGITMVSVAHRPAVLAYHDQLLEYRHAGEATGGGGWTVEHIPDATTEKRYVFVPAGAVSSSCYHIRTV
jgi:ABC-type uncharacterized transport system fused permease/ATPase subunit